MSRHFAFALFLTMLKDTRPQQTSQRYCSLPVEQVMTMIEHGIIEPQKTDPTAKNWQFAGLSLVRVQTVKRLQSDLGVNLEGSALALDLLDEVKALRQQTKALRRAMQEAEAGMSEKELEPILIVGAGST